ncbi:MAG TPA: ribose-phosphate diphosphokinase [Myxococcota bacterium]|nr:ribose-phosphate diphosphokinase [Myxococcota bacterium]
MHCTDQVVFSLQAYADLRDQICALTGLEAGAIVTKTFPDGERYARIETRVAGRDVVLIGGTVSDADTLLLYDLAAGMVSYGAHTLTLIIPYFGYGTMERAIEPGEIVTCKTRARLFSGIAAAGSGNQVVLLDLHSEGIPHYFEGHMRTVHLYAKPVILAAARRLGGEDFVLACTDAGRAKWVESLANDLGVSAAFVFKRRIDPQTTEVATISAQVQGKRVVIYDDMIRTGSSLVHAAQAYRDAGASEISAIATHGLFPEDAMDRIRATGLFTQIVCTDSHPRAQALANDWLRIESVAAIFATFLAPCGGPPES